MLLADHIFVFPPVSITGFLIWLVIVCACVGIAVIAMRTFGVTPPPWAVQIFWIVVVAVVAILAIRFVASL